jgi:hypothetical protein
MATWTEEALVPLTRSLNDLGELLTTWLKDTTVPAGQRLGELKGIVSKTQRFGGVSNDLFNFLQTLNAWAREKVQTGEASEKEFWTALQKRTNDGIDALNRSVLESFVGEKYLTGLLKTSKGVAIWLPNSASEFREMFPKFSKSKFYQEESGTGLSPWAKFIEAWYR